MRNLKKILALVLALMMVLSVMVTASASFEDVEEINPNYLEAVTVMAEAGILAGTGNGFEPTKTLDRASAAKLIAYVAEGPAAVAYAAKCETVFDDVKATNWASGFITYGAEAEYILGTGDGFNPTGTLTIEQYAAMLLRVLGIEGEYTGSKWYVAVRNNAKNEGLLAGIATYNWTDAVTREVAAQMTFNALNWVAEGVATGKYLVVGVDANLTADEKALIAEINKTPFTSMADAVVYMTALGLELTTDYSIKPQTTTEGTLMANYTAKVNPATAADEFGRPLTNVWVNGDGDIIYSEEVAPVKTYTSKVDADTIKEALAGYTMGGKKVEGDVAMGAGSTGVAHNDTNKNGLSTSTLSGNSRTPASRLSGMSRNGRVLEIYADAEKNIVNVVTVTYSVDDEIAISTPDTDGNVTYTLGTTDYVDYSDAYLAKEANKNKADTVEVYGDVKNGDVVTYVVIDGVAKVYATETVEGILSRKTSTGEYLTIGEEKIAVGSATGAVAFENYVIKTDAQKFAVDQYGYVVGLADYVATPEATVSTDYVYVLNVQTQAYVKEVSTPGASLINPEDSVTTEGKDPAAVAKVVFPDGTYSTINLTITNKGTAQAPDYRVDLPAPSGSMNTNMKLDNANYIADGGRAINNWFAYEVDEDGVYTLTVVDSSVAQVKDGLTLNEKQVKTFTVGENTLYTNSATVVTGIKLNNTSTAYNVTSKTGLIGAALTGKVLVTYAEGASTISGIYAIGADLSSAPVAPDAIYAYIAAAGDQVINGVEYKVYINGKAETVVLTTTPDIGYVYELTANTAAALVGTYATGAAEPFSYAGKVTLLDETFFVADSTYYFAEDCVVYNVTTGNTGTADVVEVGDFVNVLVVGDEVVAIYIVDEVK